MKKRATKARGETNAWAGASRGALEDKQDIKDANASIAEVRERGTESWAAVKAELGL